MLKFNRIHQLINISNHPEVFFYKAVKKDFGKFRGVTKNPAKSELLTTVAKRYILPDCGDQKQSFTDNLQNSYSKTFRKFHRKILVLYSLFNKVAGLKYVQR